MAKILKMKRVDGADVVDADATADAFLKEVTSLREQLASVAGEDVKIDNTTGARSVFAPNSIKIDADVRKSIKETLNYLHTALKADREGSGAGKPAKADKTALEKLWLEYVRNNPNTPIGVRNDSVAYLFNQANPSNDPITSTYVANAAKKGDWGSIVNESVPATS